MSWSDWKCPSNSVVWDFYCHTRRICRSVTWQIETLNIHTDPEYCVWSSINVFVGSLFHRMHAPCLQDVFASMKYTCAPLWKCKFLKIRRYISIERRNHIYRLYRRNIWCSCLPYNFYSLSMFQLIPIYTHARHVKCYVLLIILVVHSVSLLVQVMLGFIYATTTVVVMY